MSKVRNTDIKEEEIKVKEKVVKIGAINDVNGKPFYLSGDHPNVVIKVQPGSIWTVDKDISFKRLVMFEGAVVQVGEGISLKANRLHHREPEKEKSSLVEGPGEFKFNNITYKNSKDKDEDDQENSIAELLGDEKETDANDANDNAKLSGESDAKEVGNFDDADIG